MKKKSWNDELLHCFSGNVTVSRLIAFESTFRRPRCHVLTGNSRETSSSRLLEEGSNTG